MIELIVKDFLQSKLPQKVYMEYPEKPPERFFLLRRSGQGREDMLETSTLILDSYGQTRLEAARLNEAGKAAMDELTELDEVTSSKRSGDYPLEDTQNKRYRYQAVQTITHY